MTISPAIAPASNAFPLSATMRPPSSRHHRRRATPPCQSCAHDERDHRRQGQNASPTPISLHDPQIHGAATPTGTILTGGQSVSRKPAPPEFDSAIGELAAYLAAGASTPSHRSSAYFLSCHRAHDAHYQRLMLRADVVNRGDQHQRSVHLIQPSVVEAGHPVKHPALSGIAVDDPAQPRRRDSITAWV